MERDILESVGIPARLIRLASAQGGHLTREQLLEAGFSSSAIDRRIVARELTAVTQGVYQLFEPNDHVDLMQGAVLALPGAVASHQSAAHLLDLPRAPELEPTVTVVSNTTHRFPGVTVRRTDDLRPSHLTSAPGVPTTTTARTAFDLAGILSFREFDSFLEAAILAGRITTRQFQAVTAELARPGKRGSRAAKDFLADRAGSHPQSSVLERKGRHVLYVGRLPTPVPEYPIPWSPRKRFDDAYPDEQVAIEWDSRAWHEQRAAMRRDRQRDREAALHGWVLLRFTWDDVTRTPDVVVATVRELLQSRG